MKNYFISLWNFTSRIWKANPMTAMSPLFLGMGLFTPQIIQGTLTWVIFFNLFPFWLVMSVVFLVVPPVCAHAIVSLSDRIKRNRE